MAVESGASFEKSLGVKSAVLSLPAGLSSPADRQWLLTRWLVVPKLPSWGS